jgi:hypothetical protein
VRQPADEGTERQTAGFVRQGISRKDKQNARQQATDQGRHVFAADLSNVF